MGQITTDTLQCVWVNTDQSPTKVVRLGFFQQGEDLQELCQVFYPHPEAKEYAFISQYEFITCAKMPDGFGDTVKLIIKGMKGIREVTELIPQYQVLVSKI